MADASINYNRLEACETDCSLLEAAMNVVKTSCNTIILSYWSDAEFAAFRDGRKLASGIIESSTV